MVILKLATTSHRAAVWIAPPYMEVIWSAQRPEHRLLGIMIPPYRLRAGKERAYFATVERTKRGLRLPRRAIPWWSDEPAPFWVKFQDGHLVF